MSKILAESLSAIKNAEVKSKREVVRKTSSKLLLEVLKIAKREGYIAGFEHLENNRGGEVRIHLINKINNIGVISPHFPVKYDNLQKYEERYLPAKGFGILILTTSKGIITNKEAKDKKVGGKLLAFIY